MYHGWACLLLSITLVVVIGQCSQFCRWVMARTALVRDEVARPISTPAAPVLDSQNCLQEGLRDSIVWQPHGEESTRKRRIAKQKLTYGGCAVTIAGAEPEPFAEIFFKVDCITSERKTRILLTVEQVVLGIKNCERSCDKTVFIHEMNIEVCAKSWADHDCHRLLLKPRLTAQVFGLQQSSSFSLQMPIVDPRNAAVTYGTDNTICRSEPAFRWLPAVRDNGNNKVTFTWKYLRFANGSKFEMDKTRWGSRPQIGIQPSYVDIHPGSCSIEASWELKSNSILQHQQLEWDTKVSLRTAVVHGKQFLPRYTVTEGLTQTEKLLTFS